MISHPSPSDRSSTPDQRLPGEEQNGPLARKALSLPYDVALEPAEIERRLEEIMAEFGLTGQLTRILARRIAQLSVRLERLAVYESALKSSGRGHSPNLAVAGDYEMETHRSLLRTIKELSRFLPPPNRVSAKNDVRWARYTQFNGSKAVESAVVAPRDSLPDRGDLQKIADGKGITLPGRV